MSQTTPTTRIRAHARWELRLLLRNGEQLLLMFVVPVLLLFALGRSGLSTNGINAAVPTVLAVSIMATCFTSLAIGTGFERRSGALRYLGTTPLTRLDLISGKFLATAALTAMSAAVVVVLGLAMSWHPILTGLFSAVLVALLAAAAWVSWAMVLAGVLRAEAVLAIANGLFLLFIMFGGVAIATSQMPGPIGHVIDLLPSAALANGLRESLETGAFPAMAIAVLAVWTVVGVLLARRSFRWEP